jgi:Arc/MetJ family transcription regulator
MARKQLGMVDDALLDDVDRRALELGQTRREYVERALRWAVREKRHINAEGFELAQERTAALRPASEVSPRVAQPAGGVSPHLRLGNDSTSAQVKRHARPAVPKRAKKR